MEMTLPKAVKRREGADAHADGYHVCQCYGHTSELPNYKEILKPYTLQGTYAKMKCACPCIQKTKGKHVNSLYCSKRPATCDRVFPNETYRAHGPGPHKVHREVNTSADGAPVRDPATGTRLVFPNASNYGGTAKQRTFPVIGAPRRLTVSERKYENQYDRKEFLKAVLRDEICDRVEAEKRLDELENEIGLRGSRHARMLAEAAEAAKKAQSVESEDEPKTVGDQYNMVMDELRFVAQQPVGSKLNIVRMYYTVEEQEYVDSLGRKATGTVRQ
ncbi:unnamed protein product [Trypanosoma congolense IL3000]|uniref:WGS project CAEQ00000000 data, annotated contig 1156 n=1 Tax=Trypanosoma congolense (strain IL3000) TaxID=1068625 RepID=F9W475_TRYCI|nr:unnamed protein product [Trypanosoma congolense IL3000]